MGKWCDCFRDDLVDNIQSLVRPPEIGTPPINDPSAPSNVNCPFLITNPHNFPVRFVGTSMTRRNFQQIPEGTGGYNCWGWAINRTTIQNPPGFGQGGRIEDLATATRRGVKAVGMSVVGEIEPLSDVQLTQVIRGLSNKQYIIAMRAGNTDYHYMRRDHNGIWTQKCGREGWLIELIGCTPNDDRAWYSYTVMPNTVTSSMEITENVDGRGKYAPPTWYAIIDTTPTQ